MRRILAALATAALVFPAAAVAKGPNAAKVDGPGAGGGITFTGDGESGGTPLGKLAEHSGFFTTVWGPGGATNRPEGNLGPRYTLTYTVPGPDGEVDTIGQDVYPYAKAGPVTYTEPGQTFFTDRKTSGGWYHAPAALRETLISAGLPKVAPSASSSGDGGGAVSTGLLALLAAALLLGAATTVLVRRRIRPAATA